MKSKIFNFTIVFLSCFVLYKIIIDKSLISSSISYSLNLWVKNLIPSLFPFFIISDILINYNFIDYIPKFISNFLKKLFNISDKSLEILILSTISGFPSNARNARTLYDLGYINENDANHILIFSHFANPVFIISTVSLFFLRSYKMGIILLISQYISNFIVGILFRNYFENNKSKVNDSNHNENRIIFGRVIIDAISKAINSILMICGIVTVFMVLATIIEDTFELNPYNLCLVRGILEITIGIDAINILPISLLLKGMIISLFISFGGLSVHLQVISHLSDSPIKYRYFLLGRIFQVIFSVLTTFLLSLFIL